jgi:hypothetical protein
MAELVGGTRATGSKSFRGGGSLDDMHHDTPSAAFAIDPQLWTQSGQTSQSYIAPPASSSDDESDNIFTRTPARPTPSESSSKGKEKAATRTETGLVRNCFILPV